MIKKRDKTLDIAKGIFIILVVLGHSTFPYTDVIYWFHMPAFFIISGILYKENSLKLAKLTITLFVPFLVYIFINVLVRYFTNPNFEGIDDMLMLLEKHLYNGKVIGGVYWYIPVFFLTKIVFDIAHKFMKKYVLILMVASYIVAHLISINLVPERDNFANTNLTLVLPWDIDVVLIAVWYYFVGVLLRNKGKQLYSNIKIILLTFVFSAAFLISNYLFEINYFFDMKYSYYKSLFLDTTVPIVFTIFFLGLSSLIARMKSDFGLSWAGSKSLYIMFLHIPLGTNILQIENYILFTLVGVIVPLLFSLLIENNRYTTFLFTGRY